MRVTKFNYPLEKSLIGKLDLMIKRCVQKNPKRDSVLLNEGAEGEGKTTISVAEGYYIAEKTRRIFNHTRIFSDLNKMIPFLQKTEAEIAVWDEPALQALSGDSLTKIVRDLKRMLMMCRNKRHFIIINMTYFNEFGGYIVWQRPLAMIHVYSRHYTQAGRFVYIRKKYLEKLWWDWRRKHQRNYFKYSSKYVRGCFPDVLNPRYKYNVLSDFNYKYYEKQKNEAIMSIGKEGKKLSEREIKRELIKQFIKNNETLPKKIKDTDLMKLFGVSNGGFYIYKGGVRNSKLQPSTNYKIR